MAHRHPCYRHPRGVWIAACPDCAAWHQPARTAPVAAVPTTDEPQSVPADEADRPEVNAAA
jgi:hypothetical protein